MLTHTGLGNRYSQHHRGYAERGASGGVRLAEKMLRKAQGKVTGRARSVGRDPLGYWQKPTRWEWDLTEVDTAWQAGNEGTATGWEQGGIR